MGADGGQPEPASWPPSDDTSPDVRAPGREWYPGTEWYPGKEYRPPQYGDLRYRGSAYLPAGEYSSRDQEHREIVSRDEYPPPGGHSILDLDPPRRRRPGRRHQVRNGMLVGLGTGSTSAYLLPPLAARKLDITCVATSPATSQAARSA